MLILKNNYRGDNSKVIYYKNNINQIHGNGSVPLNINGVLGMIGNKYVRKIVYGDGTSTGKTVFDTYWFDFYNIIGCVVCNNNDVVTFSVYSKVNNLPKKPVIHSCTGFTQSTVTIMQHSTTPIYSITATCINSTNNDLCLKLDIGNSQYVYLHLYARSSTSDIYLIQVKNAQSGYYYYYEVDINASLNESASYIAESAEEIRSNDIMKYPGCLVGANIYEIGSSGFGYNTASSVLFTSAYSKNNGSLFDWANFGPPQIGDVDESLFHPDDPSNIPTLTYKRMYFYKWNFEYSALHYGPEYLFNYGWTSIAGKRMVIDLNSSNPVSIVNAS